MIKLMRFWLVLALLTSAPILQADSMKLEIIPLQHRLVQDIAPILQPLVAEGGSVSGMNNQLIIKTTPQNFDELMAVLDKIDRPLRSLKISVRFDNEANFQGHERGVDGYYDKQNIRIETHNPSSRHRDGESVVVQGKDGAVRYRQWNTHGRSNDNNVFFVRGVEGQPAWIMTGKTIPQSERTVVLHPYGSEVYDSVNYRDISSGFYVVPNVNGTRVTLDISPERSRLEEHSNSRIETQSAQMTITGQLGQWINLGGVSESYSDQQGQNTYRTHRSGENNHRIQVKVEELH